MAYDPTAFARVQQPQSFQQGLAASAGLVGMHQAGVQDRQQQGLFDVATQKSQRLESVGQQIIDADKIGDTSAFEQSFRELTVLDPEAATKMQELFANSDRASRRKGAQQIYAALALGENEEEQDKMIKKGIEFFGDDDFFSEYFTKVMEQPDLSAETLADTAPGLATLPPKESKERDRNTNLLMGIQFLDELGYFDPEAEQARTGIAAGNLAQRRKDYTLDAEKFEEKKRIRAEEEEFGELPPDFKRHPTDPGKVVSIPGSKTHQERSELKRKLMTQYKNSIRKGNRLISQIDDAYSRVGPRTAGLVGALAKGFPGTEAKSVKGIIQTIVSNIGFDKLQQLRDESPTGGALGQVAVRELEDLQASIANLEQAQNPEQLKANLKIVLNHYRNFLAEAEKNQLRIKDLSVDDLFIPYKIDPATQSTESLIKGW